MLHFRSVMMIMTHIRLDTPRFFRFSINLSTCTYKINIIQGTGGLAINGTVINGDDGAIHSSKYNLTLMEIAG